MQFKIKHFWAHLLLGLLCFLSPLSTKAFAKENSTNKTHPQGISAKKQNKFTQFVTKRIEKRLLKKRYQNFEEDNRSTILSRMSIGFGVISIFFILLGSSYSAIGFILGLIGLILSIAGLIFEDAPKLSGLGLLFNLFSSILLLIYLLA